MLIAALFATAAGIGGALALMWGWFAIGGALLLSSVLALRWPRSLWAGPPPPELSPAMRRAALIGICGLAAFCRLYRLNPPGLWGDDAINGLLAFRILDGAITSPFEIVSHSHSNFHALSNYPIAAAFWLFGPDPTTLRLPGIVLGGLCVPLLYGTMAPLFGSSVALLATLFYATSPPQLIYAKELVQIITGQFFQLAGLCLLVRGVASRRSGMVAAAGVPLAGCIYTYHSARLAPLVAFAYAGALLFAARASAAGLAAAGPSSPRPPQRQPPRRALGVALAVFVAALIPAIGGFIQHPKFLVQRLGETGIWPVLRTEHTLWPLWDAVWRTLLMFHYQQGPEYYWFGIATDPAVNVVIGFLLVHGLVESLSRWREPRHFLLLAWTLVGLVPGFLSTGAPRLYRSFLAMPPLYVWAALPVAQMVGLPALNWPRTMVRRIALALVIAVPLVDFNYYFYRVYTHPAFRWFQGERIVEMARTLRSFGPGWTGYLLADNFDVEHETLQFLSRAWGLQMRGVSSLVDVLPLRELPKAGALFMLSQGAAPALEAIEHMYPGHELIERRDPPVRTWWFDAWLPLASGRDHDIRAVFYPVPRADAAQPHDQPPWGLDVDYDVGGHRLTRREPYPFYGFLPATFTDTFDARWRGLLTVPEPGGYHLDVVNNGAATIWIDGQPYSSSNLVSAGAHAFELRITGAPESARLALYWHEPDRPLALVPAGAFTPPPEGGAGTADR